MGPANSEKSDSGLLKRPRRDHSALADIDGDGDRICTRRITGPRPSATGSLLKQATN
jgi:hypothetical protein